MGGRSEDALGGSVVLYIVEVADKFEDVLGLGEAGIPGLVEIPPHMRDAADARSSVGRSDLIVSGVAIDLEEANRLAEHADRR